MFENNIGTYALEEDLEEMRNIFGYAKFLSKHKYQTMVTSVAEDAPSTSTGKKTSARGKHRANPFERPVEKPPKDLNVWGNALTALTAYYRKTFASLKVDNALSHKS